MNLKLNPPFTVIYRGTLKDTGVLVGLAQIRANIGLIAFTGELTSELEDYFKTLNRWLEIRGLPYISVHPTLTGHDLDRLIDCPLRAWGWDEKECAVAIRLANLPPPPVNNAAA